MKRLMPDILFAVLILFLAASDVLLLPLAKSIATDNIWPSKLNDYLAAGRPTVGTKLRVLEPVFRKQKIGLLTADNPEQFADGCVRILQDDQMRVEMGHNARQLAEGDLSWDRLVPQLAHFYRGLIARNAQQIQRR